ncbi:MAG: pseudaminic acid synthase [Lachnospiraceae bacterium]|nr:pseudaminic acid synthase [Lachnospiraceae bacterium]
MRKEIRIGNRLIGEGHPTFIIAEMSANHNMDYNRAVQIIEAAAKAGADAIKIQTYTADTITMNSDNPCFQITQGTLWDGTTLYKLYQQAYTPWEWQADLKKKAEELGLEFFSSPFDLTAVDFLEGLQVSCYKIASFEINDLPMIRKIAKLGKPMIFATGIALKEDIEAAMEVCRQEGNDQIVLLKCVSAYPAPFEDVNLAMIPQLAKDFDCISGLSDHTMGYEVAVGSIPMGAHVIEKHMTLRRADGGADSAFSMEPEEFAAMVRSIRNVEKAFGTAGYTLGEKQIREKEHSRSLFITKDVKKGEAFSAENVRSIRPACGLHTRYYEEVLGKTATADIPAGTPLRFEHVAGMEKYGPTKVEHTGNPCAKELINE